FQHNLNFISAFYIIRLTKLVALQDASALKPQLHDKVIADDAADAPLENVAGDKVLDFIALDEFVQIRSCATQCSGHGRVHFVVQISEGIDEIVINHKQP